MARIKVTPKRSKNVKPLELGSLDKLYTFKMRSGDGMVSFLWRYHRMWESVKGLGVSELDGVLQLVQALPLEWQPWAAAAALDFVHPDMETRVIGNLIGFINLIEDQFWKNYPSPPPGSYPPLEQFIPTVHQILSDILASRPANVEPKIVEPNENFNKSDEFESLDLSFTDFGDRIESEMTSDDLDLYGQPFALEPPSPPLFLSDFPSEVPTPPPASDNMNFEVETYPSVGTTTLQPLSISEMTFTILPFDVTTGVPGPSNTNNAHIQEEESDSETSEE